MTTDRTLLRAAEAVVADLARDGGGTYERSTLLKFSPTYGYAVAMGGAAIPATAVNADLVAWLARAVAGEYETSFVGTWLDDGTVYIDAVRYITNATLAEAVGRRHGQKAIYDFASKRSIDL